MLSFVAYRHTLVANRTQDYLDLCLFLRSLFLRLCVDILCLFFFFPLGILFVFCGLEEVGPSVFLSFSVPTQPLQPGL